MFDGLIAAIGPNALLISSDLRIKRAYGDLRPFITLSEGFADLTVASVVVPEHRQHLRALAGAALRTKQPAEGLATPRADDPTIEDQLRVYPIAMKPKGEHLLLVTFTSRPREPDALVTPDAGDRLKETERALAVAMEQLEVSSEELKTLNEEMLSSNEEMQSLNEELETSNEELQSSNEELTTINEELTVKAAEMRELTADLHSILNNVQTPLLVVNRSLEVTTISAEARRFFEVGETPTPIRLTFLTPPIGFPPLIQAIQDAFASGAPVSVDFETDAVAGRLDVNLFARVEEGAVGAIVTVLDKTDVAASRRAAADSAEEMAHLFDIAPVGMLQRDAEGRVLKANQRMAELLGLDFEIAPGARWDAIKPSANPSADVEADRRLLEAEAGHHAEVQLVRGGDGVERWLRFRAKRADGPDGAPPRIFVAAMDITELVAAEQREAERVRLLEMAAHVAGVGYWRLDLRSGDLTWSEECYRLHGVDADAYRPTLEDALGFYHAEDRDQVAAAVAAARRDGVAYRITARLVRGDGATRRIETAGELDRQPDGASIALIGVIREIEETPA